jgi:hypothetical protein
VGRSFETAERGCAFDQGKSDAPDTTQFKFGPCGDAGVFKDDRPRSPAGDFAGEIFELFLYMLRLRCLSSGHAYRHRHCFWTIRFGTVSVRRGRLPR